MQLCDQVGGMPWNIRVRLSLIVLLRMRMTRKMLLTTSTAPRAILFSEDKPTTSTSIMHSWSPALTDELMEALKRLNTCSRYWWLELWDSWLVGSVRQALITMIWHGGEVDRWRSPKEMNEVSRWWMLPQPTALGSDEPECQVLPGLVTKPTTPLTTVQTVFHRRLGAGINSLATEIKTLRLKVMIQWPLIHTEQLTKTHVAEYLALTRQEVNLSLNEEFLNWGGRAK